MKIKKVIISIIAFLVVIIGSGAVYVALGGTINGVPVLEWMGIKFSSENYAEYVENIENQVIENDDIKIALESKVCDDGFTILQFRVNISEEKLNSYKTEEDIENGWEVPFCYLSFNDPVINNNGYTYTELNGANYNLIIDQENIWVRGYSAQQIEEISESEYIIYQMWFLDETTLDGKEEFTITLNDVVVGLGEDAIAVDGKFEIEISKEKALSETVSYIPTENNSLTYKKMTKTLEKIAITPLQNILTIKTVYEDVDINDITNMEDNDYVGPIGYVAYDQDGNNISAYIAGIQAKITYEDGTVEEGYYNEFEFSRRDKFEHATYEVVEKIAIEKNSSITGINLKLYEIEERILQYNYFKAVGEFEISDLNSNNVEVIDRGGEYIFNDIYQEPTEELKIFLKAYCNEEYEDFYEYWSTNSTENEGKEYGNEYLPTQDEVKYVEISILDENAQGLEYTDYVRIEDENVIGNLIDLINDSTAYPEFDEDFGVGDFFEGAPILILGLEDGTERYIVAYDKFAQDDYADYINVFYIKINADKYVYKCSGLSTEIENYYYMYCE